MPPSKNPNSFFNISIQRPWLLVHILLTLFYFYVITILFQKGHLLIYVLLIIGETFHVWQALVFDYTLWFIGKSPKRKTDDLIRSVNIFITVAGESVDVVKETAQAAKNIQWPDKKIYILNDGFVAKKDNWQEIEDLADRLGVGCITRKKPGGAKAGNINNALRQTESELVVILDADHVPHSDFLIVMAPYFADPKVAFVQAPQFYKNYEENYITGAAWEQQQIFFGPICEGKDALNSTTMCGTNMVIRRSALLEVGGMCETSIAEDFLTGYWLHERGYKSVYVPRVMSEGLAPQDMLSYTNQQYRWARGSLELIFHYNPLFNRGLNWTQKIQYLSSAGYFLNGFVVLIDALLPLLYFYTGWVPFHISTMNLAAIFLPYMLLTISILRMATDDVFSYRALAFSISSFFIQCRAAIASIFGFKDSFKVTSKQKISGNFIVLAIPHILYLILVLIGVGLAVYREGITPSVTSNIGWSIFNVALFMPYISGSLPDMSHRKQKASSPIMALFNGKKLSR